ncbi:uncharacterized protein si:ch211-13c6.2 isoform X2 [Kryptolebias marmoratus]|uniref:uncharacterized protein si:ch211-13c6.2 isoform X2 n=1 Tax=Kryptolebias marmoratus TaxID=37003 RepID=UPI000D5304FD|nr:uncharacterized protein si:ch211-13c6.2 isoform X2 [Kryptolebias marmoratus]
MISDNLETPYEEEDEFIECTVCDKSLRGNSLYKIHLTTPGHIKRENFLVAEGKAVRQHVVPKFKDILEYLEYLNLDEPIIGLNFVEEVPAFDPQLGPKYNCRLCNQAAVIVEMICHVIGRKHRQRYVEVERPDLVTWDSQTVKTQVGKSIRAKAEIIERQDGRGTPKLLLRKRGVEGKLNISRVPPNQRQKRDQNIPQKAHQDVPPLLPEFKDYKERKNFSGYQENPGFYPDEPPKKKWFEMGDMMRHGRFDEKPGRSDYREGFDYRKDYKNPDLYDPFENEFPEQSQSGGMPGPHDAPRYGYGEQMPHGQGQDANYYPAGAPPYKRPYPERDALEEFYSEEVRRGQVRSHGYQPSSQMMYPEGDKQRCFMEGGPVTHDNMAGARRQGLGEPEAKRRSLSSPLDGDRSHEQMLIKDYHHEARHLYQEKAFDNSGPNRARPSSGQRHVDISSAASDIPEPFRRFLKGSENDERRSKRRSRFSDASPEEVKMAKETFMDEYGAPYTQTGRDSRAGGGPLRPEALVTQYSDHYTGLQNPHFNEGYSRGSSESGGVFDMLKNVEIENAEEANFLKSKLSSVLEEFKNKKLEKAVYDSQSRAGVSTNYGDSQRDDSDHRRPEDPSFSHRRGWEQRDYIPEERQQEYNHPVNMDGRHSSRGRFEDLLKCRWSNLIAS